MFYDTQHIKTYKCLDVKIKNDVDGELICLCPFCEDSKEAKLYINKEQGLFSCKVCGLEGNKYTFIKLWYKKHLLETTREHYNALSKVRGKIPYEAFEAAGLAYNKGNKEWIIPVFKDNTDDPSILNLRIWNKDTNILKHLGGCSAHMYGNVDGNTVYICEGEWDAIALQWLVSANGETGVSVIAMPGASTFKEEWAERFNDKNVIFLYDNDKPGQEGCARAIRVLTKYGKPKSIKKLYWPEHLPDKYDIRDYVCENLKTISEGWVALNNLCGELKEDEKPTYIEMKRETFNQVLNDYERSICLTEDIRKGLILLFSVIFSNRLKDSPLWLFIIGPASSGKSMILQSVAAKDHTKFASNFNAKTLVSGFMLPGGHDPSLLPQVIGKSLIIKEYTEVMGLPLSEQEQIFSTLRGAYDGRVDRTYANGVVRIYPEPGSGHDTCHFSILAGVTNAIHASNRASLGERFLKYQMFEDNQDTTGIIEAAVASSIGQSIPETELHKSAEAFIKYKFDHFFIPDVPKYIQSKIIGLAQIVSIARAQVERKNGELLYRPSPEVGARLAKQMIKFVQMIAFTLGKNAADDECYDLVKRLGLDTSHGWSRDVLLAIAKEDGITKAQIMMDADIKAAATCDTALQDLLELKAIIYEKIETGAPGQPPRAWKLSPRMKKLFELADINPKADLASLPNVPKEYRAKKNDGKRRTFRRFIASK